MPTSLQSNQPSPIRRSSRVDTTPSHGYIIQLHNPNHWKCCNYAYKVRNNIYPSFREGRISFCGACRLDYALLHLDSIEPVNCYLECIATNGSKCRPLLPTPIDLCDKGWLYGRPSPSPGRTYEFQSILLPKRLKLFIFYFYLPPIRNQSDCWPGHLTKSGDQWLVGYPCGR